MTTALSFTHLTHRSAWPARELVVLGVFAAAAKLSALLVTLAMGGMNPIGLFLKSVVFTTFVVVMLFKVRRPGTLFLFTTVNVLVSLLLMGASVTLIPSALAAALLAEGLMKLAGGIKTNVGLFVGVAALDLFTKVFAMGFSYLMMREAPMLILTTLPIIALGWVGSVTGLFTGLKVVKELRHAGFIRQ